MFHRNDRNKKILITLILLLSGIAGFYFSWQQHKKNIIFSEHREIQTFHYPALLMKQLEGDPHAGEKIFKMFCASCHGEHPVIEVNAPLINDKKAWQLRKKLGMPTLMKLTLTGVGAMPARGGCFECDDEQLRITIQYIFDH